MSKGSLAFGGSMVPLACFGTVWGGFDMDIFYIVKMGVDTYTLAMGGKQWPYIF
jgi:hypothetical protein